ncbi:MAG: hypothetical protein HQK49_15000 [Oligoflexia bacterium]|nr:hypothetical protein [Oligoflexia bacterium]
MKMKSVRSYPTRIPKERNLLSDLTVLTDEKNRIIDISNEEASNSFQRVRGDFQTPILLDATISSKGQEHEVFFQEK